MAIKKINKQYEKLFEEYYAHMLSGDILHHVLFDSLPSLLMKQLSKRDLARISGEKTQLNILLKEQLSQTLIGNSKIAVYNAIMDKKTLLADYVKTLKVFKDKVIFCYQLYHNLGFCFEHKVVEETDKKLTLKVTACPHIQFTKKNPVACFSCMGVKLGITKAVLGKEIRIDVLNFPNRLAMGGKYCLFDFYKPR